VRRLCAHYSLRPVKPLDRWAYPYAESHLSKDVKCHVAESTPAEHQFAKALEQAHAAPVDKTTLLIHLVAARAFLGEGQAPRR